MRGRDSTGVLAAGLLAAAAAALSVPMLRMWPPTSDEGAMLTGAAKLLHGGIFYRDVAAFPTPGAWYLLAGAMGLAGESVLTARVLSLIAFAVTVGLFYLIARRILTPGLALAFGAALLAVKFWAWPAWSCYLYADAAFVFAAGGALAFLAGWQGRRGSLFFISGLLFGAAALCKQTVGGFPTAAGLAVLGLAWLVARRPEDENRLRSALGLPASRGRIAAFAGLTIAGVLAALAVPAAYFGSHGLLKDTIVSSVVQPVSGYLPLSQISYIEMLNWTHFRSLTENAMQSYQAPILRMVLLGPAAFPETKTPFWHAATEAYSRIMYLLVLVFFAATTAHLVRRARTRERGNGTEASALEAPALALMAGLFASAFPRADYYHVIDVAPAWLLVGFMAAAGWARAAQRESARRLALGGAAVAAAVWLAVGGLATARLWSKCDHILNLPRFGRIRAMWSHEEIQSTVNYIRSHTEPGTPLFVLGAEAYCYFLCDRYSPWPYAQMYPGQTGPDDGAQLARLIERERIPYILRSRMTRGSLPPVGFYAPALARFVTHNYSTVSIPLKYDPTHFRVLRRNDLPDDR